mgnify:CR=1 FL=1
MGFFEKLKSSVKTGDNKNVIIYMGVAIVSICVIAGLILFNRKRNVVK